MASSENDLWNLETRSEAVYMDCVSEDAEAGFVARLCRFPDVDLAWTWLHVFHHGHVHSYTNHEVPCSSDVVDEAADEVLYEAGEFRFERQGDRFNPRAASFAGAGLLHSGTANPHGEGVLPCQISARFEPEHEGVQSRAGRSEVLGRAVAEIELGDIGIELDARGQFHEQIQLDPRFNRPFTYATLRGPDGGCIFIRGKRGATGTLTRNGISEPISAVKISAPGTIRRLEITVDSGERIFGEAIATYQYEIPIFHMSRPGTLVTADLGGTALSGCINDLVIGDLSFDEPN